MLLKLAIAFGVMCRTFSKAILLSTSDLGDVGQPLNLFGGLVPAAPRRSAAPRDRDGQVGQRRVQVGPVVVQHAGQGREPVLELNDLFLAVAQRADEGLQVLDDVDDVAAAVGEDPPDAGQLRQCLPSASRRCRPMRSRRCR